MKKIVDYEVVNYWADWQTIEELFAEVVKEQIKQG